MLKSSSILIIDDDKVALELYEGLGEQYAEVDICVSAEELEAVQAKDNVYDLVIFDFEFCDRGLNYFHQLMDDGKYPLAQWLVFTNESADTYVDLALSYGAQDYLVKPLSALNFYQKIEQILLRGSQLVEDVEREKVIFVVDDNPSELQRLSYILGKEYKLELINSGEVALEKIREGAKPDLILLDIVMQGTNGFGVLDQLGSLPGASGIPVICLSSKNVTAFKTNAYHLGALDYLVKPYNPTVLTQKINRLIGS